MEDICYVSQSINEKAMPTCAFYCKDIKKRGLAVWC